MLQASKSKITELEARVVNSELVAPVEKLRVDEADFLYMECSAENTRFDSEVAKVKRKRLNLMPTDIRRLSMLGTSLSLNRGPYSRAFSSS